MLILCCDEFKGGSNRGSVACEEIPVKDGFAIGSKFAHGPVLRYPSPPLGRFEAVVIFELRRLDYTPTNCLVNSNKQNNCVEEDQIEIGGVVEGEGRAQLGEGFCRRLLERAACLTSLERVFNAG